MLMLATTFKKKKKKKALNLLQHRSILPILIGQVSELLVQMNSILNHLNNDTAFTAG